MESDYIGCYHIDDCIQFVSYDVIVFKRSIDTIDKDDLVAKMKEKLEELDQIDAKITRVNAELKNLS